MKIAAKFDSIHAVFLGQDGYDRGIFCIKPGDGLAQITGKYLKEDTVCPRSGLSVGILRLSHYAGSGGRRTKYGGDGAQLVEFFQDSSDGLRRLCRKHKSRRRRW